MIKLRTFAGWTVLASACWLLACGGSESRSATGLSIVPPAATLPPLGTQAFAATAASVTWTVKEGGAGGSVTSTGLYTAPATPGRYTVVALESTSGLSGEAVVTVTSNQASTSHGLAIPTTHPRLWYDAGRLDRARSWYQSHPFTPSSGDYIARATRGLLAGDSAQCRAAIDWALATTSSMPMSGVSCDECRWSGEGIILTYDWCNAYMTPAERSTFIAETNAWVDFWRTQDWGGIGMHHNNYYWGYLRNELEWAITSYHDNVAMAETLLDDVFTARLANDFYPATTRESRGGVGHEGSQYGPYLTHYATVPFASAWLLGRDVFSETNFWKEAVYAYIYSVTPAVTTWMGQNEFTFFPWSDEEQWQDGNQVSDVKSNFMTAAAMRWSDLNVGRHARQWLDMTGGTPAWFVLSVDPGGAGQAFTSLPPDYYAAGPKYVWGRNAWGPSSTVFMLQLGEGPGSGHAHVDWGTWQLWRGGRFVSRESASYGEGVTGYGGSGTVDAGLAPGHNSLLINGAGSRTDPWISGLADVRRLESQPGYFYADVDLSATAGGSRGNAAFVHWEREFVFVRALETMVILDRVQSASASDVKTFLMHCETAPAIAGRSATCTNGSQSLVMSTLAPGSATYRSVTEGGTIGQYRIEVDTAPGTAQSYILTVLQAKDASAPALSPTATDTGGGFIVQLAPGTSISFDKGMASAGGTITTGGTTTAFRGDVQNMTVTDAGPVWY